MGQNLAGYSSLVVIFFLMHCHIMVDTISLELSCYMYRAVVVDPDENMKTGLVQPLLIFPTDFFSADVIS